MIFRLMICGMVFIAACSPLRETPVTPVAKAVTEPAVPQAAPPVKRVDVGPPRVHRVTRSGVTFEGVSFDDRSHRLRVVDQDGAPGARFADAAAAAALVDGLAAVNGGFFTPEGGPLGLVIANGKRYGAWNSASSLGSGVWHADAAGNAAISRREALGKTRAAAMQELLQAGPMLVADGRAVGGLDATKSSVRTVILWDGGHRWWIGRTSPCTLARCAELLATAPPAGWTVRQALNLDGGRSSELWVSGNVAGGPLKARPPWNRPVRNFLVLVPDR